MIETTSISINEEKSGRILFISAIDFKEKSIQVIKRTPEAFVAAGWRVRYIVARDTTDRGNYFYERELNLPGIEINRINWPLARLRNAVRGRWSLYAITRLAGILVVFQLATRAARALQEEPVDVIYGYEVHGVLAARLIRLFGAAKRAKFVARFQGTWIMELLEKKQWLRLCANVDQIIALRSRCDLLIMTDDGTRGDQALLRLRSPAYPKLRFWVNGTDVRSEIKGRDAFRRALKIPPSTTVLLSVSRLEPWKRIDRGIALVSRLHNLGAKVTYIVVGQGSEMARLKRAAAEAGVSEQTKFIGAVPHEQVYDYMSAADFFVSMYDLSNVGNPLLEAIRLRKIVVTLDNGDTSNWIQHGINGLIYDISRDFISHAANDILQVMEDVSWREKLFSGVDRLARDRLWTWQERLQREVDDVAKVIHQQTSDH